MRTTEPKTNNTYYITPKEHIKLAFINGVHKVTAIQRIRKAQRMPLSSAIPGFKSNHRGFFKVAGILGFYNIEAHNFERVED